MRNRNVKSQRTNSDQGIYSLTILNSVRIIKKKNLNALTEGYYELLFLSPQDAKPI